MTGTEIVDRSAVEILIDHRRTDVRRTGNCRRISELLADAAHDGGNRALLFAGRLHRTALGERNRGGQRPAPRAEILGGELLAEKDAHVIVESLARQVAESGVVEITEEPTPSAEIEQLGDRPRELRVDERRAHDRLVLRAKMEGDAIAAHANVLF